MYVLNLTLISMFRVWPSYSSGKNYSENCLRIAVKVFNQKKWYARQKGESSFNIRANLRKSIKLCILVINTNNDLLLYNWIFLN